MFSRKRGPQPMFDSQPPEKIFRGFDGYTCNVKVLIPASGVCGKILGKKGCVIKKLQEDNDVKMAINSTGNTYPGTDLRVCLVSGNVAEGVAKTVTFIIEKIYEEFTRVEKVQLVISATTVGKILGKKGADIRALQSKCGVDWLGFTDIDKDSPLGHERVLTIMGSQVNVLKVILPIMETISQDWKNGGNLAIDYDQSLHGVVAPPDERLPLRGDKTGGGGGDSHGMRGAPRGGFPGLRGRGGPGPRGGPPLRGGPGMRGGPVPRGGPLHRGGPGPRGGPMHRGGPGGMSRGGPHVPYGAAGFGAPHGGEEDIWDVQPTAGHREEEDVYAVHRARPPVADTPKPTAGGGGLLGLLGLDMKISIPEKGVGKPLPSPVILQLLEHVSEKLEKTSYSPAEFREIKTGIANFASMGLISLGLPDLQANGFQNEAVRGGNNSYTGMRGGNNGSQYHAERPGSNWRDM